MRENQVSGEVLDAAIRIHRELGPGLLESVYETLLEFELQSRGLEVSRQVAIPVLYRGVKLGDGFRADLIVERKVIVEVKSLELVPPVAYKILLKYLRLADLRLGVLVNFGAETVREGFKRVVNALSE